VAGHFSFHEGKSLGRLARGRECPRLPRRRFGGLPSQRHGCPSFSRRIVLSMTGSRHEGDGADALRRELAAERDRLRVLLDISNSVGTELRIDRLIRALAATLKTIVPHDWMDLALYDAERDVLRVHTLVVPAGMPVPVEEGRETPVDAIPPGKALRERKAYVKNTEAECLAEAADDPESTKIARRFNVRSVCFLPLISRGRPIGLLNFVSAREGTFDERTVGFLTQIANQIAPAVDNALAYDRLAAMKEQLAKEKVYLEEELREERGPEEGPRRHRDGRCDRFDGPRPRRDGHRQGARRARDPHPEPAQGQHVRQAQLRGDPDGSP
jgi:transcriptional regulator with GAF, ATPase, and Fis domain